MTKKKERKKERKEKKRKEKKRNWMSWGYLVAEVADVLSALVVVT